MKALISYYFLDYIKSYRYVPPLTIYLVTLVVNYAYKPNPVLSSTAVTAVYLFLLMAWFTLSFFHSEDPTQQHLTILHAKRKDYKLSKTNIFEYAANGHLSRTSTYFFEQNRVVNTVLMLMCERIASSF